jgi:hypothetical protein
MLFVVLSCLAPSSRPPAFHVAASSCAVSDWEACGDTFYCEEHLYDLNWPDVDLETHK